jgi:Ca2+-binding RTX toxin-like protein
MGTLGLNFDNDVRARGNLTINTGRDLNIDGFADLASDGFGAATGGDVIVNAGRDINLLNSTGTDGSLGAEGSAGGNTILSTGPGGFVRLLASSTATLFSSTGDVQINADRMVIDATSGITASGGQVTIQPVTEGWNVDLGSTTDGAFALELSDAELDRIFTPTLNVGSLQSGRLDVTSAISPAGAPNLILRASTDIGIAAAMTVGGALTLRAGDNIFQLAASAITAGGAFNAFVDELGDDDGIGGVATANGTITATSVDFHGNAEKDTLNGASGDDVLNGNSGNDTLQGFGGADLLDGGIGADQMTGGLGDDEFIVDHAGDTVIEAVGEGNDTVKSDITHTLEDNVEDLTLTGSADINGTGNSLDNEITGNSGDNTLNGLAGADTLRGGLGNDIFVVDNVADVVTETGAGTDLVQSSATFALGANVENLTLTGGAAIDGTGNTLANILTGNGAANTLNGGGGADTMSGGLGSDIYVVDNVGDVVTETGVGTDKVQSTITFTLGTSFENLTLTGGAAIDGTGNTPPTSSPAMARQHPHGPGRQRYAGR